MKISKILKQIIKEAQEQDPENLTSNVQVMLDRFKILNPVLTDLLGTDNTDLENIVSNIEVAVFKPTTFKVTFKNGNDMMLKYTPQPVEVNGISKSDFKPKDFFQCLIVGKKFNLINRAQFQQAVDYIGNALKNAPVTGKADQAGTGTGGAADQQGADANAPDDTTDNETGS